jgi:hypothetical protein
LKAQLSARIAAEEGEQKRRIEAEEEKAVLSVQLEAARGSQTVSAGAGDNSDLDTYRVSTQRLRPSLIASELPGVAYVMTAGKTLQLLYVDMSSAKHALTYTRTNDITNVSGSLIPDNVGVQSVRNPSIERICSRSTLCRCQVLLFILGGYLAFGIALRARLFLCSLGICIKQRKYNQIH